MPNSLLNEEITSQVSEIFKHQLVHPVEILFFTREVSGDFEEDSYQLLKEVASISDKIHLSIHSADAEPRLVQQFEISNLPGFVITGRDGENYLDYNLHFAGIPSGYEFSSLIQAIIMASKRDSGLKPSVRQEIKGLTHPVNLKVFVTPT